MRFTSFILLFLVVAGCAANRRSVVPDANTGAPTTRSANPRAELTLAEIVPDEPATQPSTRPATTQPSLEALDAYARGRAALAERQYYTAINLLERARQLDPDSAQVHYQLAQAYKQSARVPAAMAELHQAVSLQPDWLDAHLELALLQQRGTSPATGPAIDPVLQSLVAATRTTQYASRDSDAAIVDYHLARALAQAGYDRAATEQYEKLLWRLSRKSLSIRGQPTLAALAARPEPVELDLARLYERRGRTSSAIAVYQKICERTPELFEPQARLVRAWLADGRTKPARERVAQLVSRFKASPASVELLRQVYAGDEAGAVAVLRELSTAEPNDNALLLAYADALRTAGRGEEAEQLIATAAARGGKDPDLFRRLIGLRSGRNDTLGAARLLIEACAARPAATGEVAPLWQPLIRSWRVNALRPEDLRRIALPPSSEPARNYWIARLAAEDRRESLALSALKAATEDSSVFAPAYLLRAQQVALSTSIDQATRVSVIDDLVRRAQNAGQPALALAVRAIAASADGEHASPQDLPFFEQAMTAGADWPEFLLSYAAALKRATQEQKFEQVMWKVISDNPSCDEAYRVLLQHHLDQRQLGAALKVVSTWLQADPRSRAARMVQAEVLAASAQQAPQSATEPLLLDLIREDPGDVQALAAAHRYFVSAGKRPQSVELMDRLLAEDPLNGAALERVVSVNAERGEAAASTAALSASETAARSAGGQANLLYFIGQLHFRLGDKAKCETLMEAALNQDPGHVPSSNDLAYFWAETDRNLARAEQLARQAVAAEPQNAAYLDTLGWTLYKQGRFGEAGEVLTRAADLVLPVDPVVLDHLGDVLYRRGDADGATRQWRRASELLSRNAEPREDLLKLRLQVDTKLRQRAAGEPVEVSPVAEARAGE